MDWNELDINTRALKLTVQVFVHRFGEINRTSLDKKSQLQSQWKVNRQIVYCSFLCLRIITTHRLIARQQRYFSRTWLSSTVLPYLLVMREIRHCDDTATSRDILNRSMNVKIRRHTGTYFEREKRLLRNFKHFERFKSFYIYIFWTKRSPRKKFVSYGL